MILAVRMQFLGIISKKIIGGIFMLKFQKRLIALTMLCVSILSSGSHSHAMSLEKLQEQKKIKNVIVLIADGMSIDGVTLTRWYNAYDQASGKIDTSKNLSIDQMASGLVRTYWQANGVVGAITDSAPAGTALATGVKTMDKFIGVSEEKKPLATILETSKNIGKATGLVATSQIMHATPAAYSSHFPDRSKEAIIAEQQVYNSIDVVFGGGYGNLQNREDDEDLVNVLKNQGYQYLTDKKDLTNAKNKTWGMFAESAMSYEMDQKTLTPSEPSLSEMTKKSIDILSKDKDGFFLMVESSKVDWAAHANDPIGMISEINAFDQSVKAALDYAKKNEDTMVIAITDHGNSGLTIGNKQTDTTYSKDSVDKFVAPLKKAKLTGEGIGKKISGNTDNLVKIMAEYGGISDLSTEEIAQLKAVLNDEKKDKQALYGSKMQALYGQLISKRASLGFTTSGHTGEDITLYTYLPNDERLTGTINNTDIPKAIAKIWGIDLSKETKNYYTDAKEALEKLGAKVSIDDSDQNNVKLVATKGKTTLEIPENKNYVLLNGKNKELESVTVNVENTFYVNNKALKLMK